MTKYFAGKKKNEDYFTIKNYLLLENQFYSLVKLKKIYL